MQSKPSQSRSGKGSVQVKKSNDRLQLVFSHPVVTPTGEIKTKRFYLSTGQYDDSFGRQRAAVLAAQIQRDIDYGEFDASLVKYKPAASLTTVTPITPEVTPNIPPKPDLFDVWTQYEQFKKPQVSQSTYAVDYRKYRNHIARLPTRDLDEAIVIRDYLLANLTPNAAKRTLTNLHACCDWALKSKLIDKNPFQGMSRDIHVPKSDSEENDINPFTREERDIVIQAFEESNLYSYYAPLVKFLFFTGCRPSEAIVVQWKHVSDRFLTFDQAITISVNGLSLKQGLKTQSQRRFPINAQLRHILGSIRPENCNPSDFIFRSRKGGVVDFGDFLNHAWRGYKNRHGKQIDGIVTQLVRQGRVSEYRVPYQCRHTFLLLSYLLLFASVSAFLRCEPMMHETCRFRPASFSWVAVHPQPKGVIQFIGGAFFGTFPTIFYRYFLQTLFEQGYTIIALPFRFSFRHWAIAIDLLKEQEILRDELTAIAHQLGYAAEVYQSKANYFWLGHSLGCKYIALLEFLSGPQWKSITEACVEPTTYQQIEAIIANAGLEDASILSQPSLLVAPDISNTESAIPIRSIAHFLDRVGLGVKPTRKQTQCFVERSQLFNLTTLISFDKDTLAGSETDALKSEEIKANSDVLWLIQQLRERKFPILHQELEGKHLEPLGWRVGEYIVDLNPFDKFIEPLKLRRLEGYVIQFLDQLRQRQSQIGVDLQATENNTLNPGRSPSDVDLIPLKK